jgi:hypothetical protein
MAKAKKAKNTILLAISAPSGRKAYHFCYRAAHTFEQFSGEEPQPDTCRSESVCVSNANCPGINAKSSHRAGR